MVIVVSSLRSWAYKPGVAIENKSMMVKYLRNFGLYIEYGVCIEVCLVPRLYGGALCEENIVNFFFIL